MIPFFIAFRKLSMFILGSEIREGVGGWGRGREVAKIFSGLV